MSRGPFELLYQFADRQEWLDLYGEVNMCVGTTESIELCAFDASGFLAQEGVCEFFYLAAESWMIAFGMLVKV